MIFNTSKLDLERYYEEGWTLFLTPSLFPHLNDLLKICGQKMFEKKPELFGIPPDYVNPPIRIRSNVFKVGVSENVKTTYSILALHPPFNVTLETIAPISWVFNSSSIRDQYRMMVLIMSRCPIIYIDGKTQLVFNFLSLLGINDVPLNTYFEKNDISYKEFSKLASVLLGYNPNAYPDDEKKLPNYSSNDERDYALFKTMYNDGAYTGIVSPIANDYVQGLAQGETSDFSNVSFLKCLFQIACLGIAYNTSKQYTLNNACVLINKGTNIAKIRCFTLS